VFPAGAILIVTGSPAQCSSFSAVSLGQERSVKHLHLDIVQRVHEGLPVGERNDRLFSSIPVASASRILLVSLYSVLIFEKDTLGKRTVSTS
jgi:hypothetical protein